MDSTGEGSGFGALLRAGRQATGVSQRELAARAGLSVAAIRDLEQGRSRRPRPAAVEALVGALGLTGDGAASFRHAAAGPHPAVPKPPLRHADPDEPVRLAILGPLTVHRGREPVPVGRGASRAVLGRLALSVNTPVPASELVSLLGDAPAVALANALHTRLSRLRSALRPTGPDRAVLISRTPAGYQLNLADGQLDLAEFRCQVRQARAAEPLVALAVLEAALALWRGNPLEDVPDLHRQSLVTAVMEERIAASLRHADLALATSQPGRCLPQLRELAAANPLHEPLHARLITALANSNLQASALDTYAGIRRRLVEDLGIEPSPELVDIHQRVLRQQHVRPVHLLRQDRRPTATSSPCADRPHAAAFAERTTAARIQGVHDPARPAQLPSRVAGFAGRTGHLAELDDLVRRTGGTAAGAITVVAGSAGVGKTALAVHWAHAAAPRFPDGQLYVNLRGFDPGGRPVRPGEVLHGFLGALGVPAALIPADDDGRAALYRTMLAGRRLLILLDNAADADQVRPLLPGCAGCFVLVTSRNQLTGLIVSMRARLLTLPPLTGAEARQLLAARLSPTRLAAEADAIAELIDRCQRLPLALALIAARLAAQPATTIRALARQLGDEDPSGSLDTLSVGDASTDLRTVFSWSYRHLSPDAARLFRLLGIHPGPDVSPAAVASLLAVTPARVRALLRELTGNHLLQEQRPDRFEFHDLLRAYAAELAKALDTPAARQQALHRVLDYYLVSAHTAAALLEPLRERVPIAVSQRGVLPEPLSTRLEALSWFAAERAALLAAVRRAEAEGSHARCWQLAHIVSTCLYARGHWHDLASAQRTAMRAARRGGERTGEGHAHLGLARVYSGLGRWAKMRPHLRRALAIFADSGDHAGLARAHNAMALSYSRRGAHLRALHHNQHALRHFRLAGIANAYGQALNDIGWDYALLGRYRPALSYCRRALQVIDALAEPTEAAHTWDSLGYVHHHLRERRRAVACYERAVRLFRENGSRYHEAESLTRLGDTYRAAGRPDAARAVWQQARDILDDLHHPDTERVHALLAGLDAGEPARERVPRTKDTSRRCQPGPASGPRRAVVAVRRPLDGRDAGSCSR